MKIERVDLIQIRMRLIAPFETSYARQSELDKLILRCTLMMKSPIPSAQPEINRFIRTKRLRRQYIF